MKQVTMESVKERIAQIEAAKAVIKCTGMGLSLRNEFELACLQQLVAVTEQVRLLTEQRNAVVAESAVIDSERLAWAELYGNEMGDPEIIENAKSLPKPATDASIAALRAEASADAFSHAEDLVRNEIACLKERSPTLKEMACLANAFHSMAGQLRESKGAQG